jgi:hypothetical protein
MTPQTTITRAQAEAMSDRELLAAAVAKQSPRSHEYNARALILRNGRWGTCSGCPHEQDGKHPEECDFTQRYDHNIDATSDGKFFSYGKEVPRSEIIDLVVS